MTKLTISLKPFMECLVPFPRVYSINQFLFDTKGTDFPASDWLADVLRARDLSFNNPDSYSFGLLKGNLYEDHERIDEKIEQDAVKSGGIVPPVKAAFCLGQMLKVEYLERQGLGQIILMHKQITDLRFTEKKFRIGFCLESDGRSKLEACYGLVGGGWPPDTGFVYLTKRPS